ncbi:MAG: sugar MFS transporter [Bryobacteraceae bacterium]
MAITNAKSSVAATGAGAPPSASTKSALSMVMVLYFIWGSITSLNDILIPHLKSIFTLNYAEAMLVQFMFFSAYFVFAYPSGRMIEWIGYKRTMVAGLVILALGALLFIPAAQIVSFPVFLIAFATLAAGMTFLQVSANPYVSVLGPPATAAARLNLAGVFNSLGTTVAPYIGSLLILSAAPLSAIAIRKLAPAALQAYRIEQASSVKMPYLVIAGVLLLFAVAIGLFKLPSISSHDSSLEGDPAAMGSIWNYRHLVLGVLGIFVYVGAEVTVGSLIANYIAQRDIGNMSIQDAAKYLSVYWGGLMVGRFLGASVLRRAPSHTVLGIAGIVALILTLVSVSTFGAVAMWSMLLIGLFESIMWPNIFTLAIAGLGPLTSRGSGLLISAIIGGAIIPLAQGFLADHIGLHHSFLLIAIPYIYIAYYGFKGYKPRVAA